MRLLEFIGLGNNYDKLGNPDYIGTSHYRRFLKFDINSLDKRNVYVNKFNFHHLSVLDQILFAETDKDLLMKYLNVYLMFKPEDNKLLNDFLNEHYLYSNNLFIMYKTLFFDYFKFLKLNINICKLFLSNINYLQIKQNQLMQTLHEGGMFGMFLERMTGFYLYKLEKSGCNIIPCELIGIQNSK